jgi:hypothetical protein
MRIGWRPCSTRHSHATAALAKQPGLARSPLAAHSDPGSFAAGDSGEELPQPVDLARAADEHRRQKAGRERRTIAAAENLEQLVACLLGGTRPLGGLALEELRKPGRDRSRARGIPLGGRNRLRAPREDLRQGGVGRDPAHQVVKKRAERVEVGPLRGGAESLLARKIEECACHLSGRSGFAPPLSRESEVEQLDAHRGIAEKRSRVRCAGLAGSACRYDHDVRWLEIAVDDSSCVERGKAREDLDGHLEKPLDLVSAVRPEREELVERGSLEQLHREEELAAREPDVGNSYDVLVADSRQRAHFGDQPVLVPLFRVTENLQREMLARPAIANFENSAHGAFAQELEDLQVRRQSRWGRGAEGGHAAKKWPVAAIVRGRPDGATSAATK